MPQMFAPVQDGPFSCGARWISPLLCLRHAYEDFRAKAGLSAFQ